MSFRSEAGPGVIREEQACLGPPSRLPSDDCPAGVFRLDMEPILDWMEHLDEVVVKFKKGVSHVLPDRLSFGRYTIVSAQCRELFERTDPDGGHIYIPASLLTVEKKPVDGEWFYMWCGRSFFADKKEHTSGIIEDAMTHGIHYECYLAVRDRCEFFKDIPLWTIVGVPGPRYMSRSAFAQVKQSDLTGFWEYTMPQLSYWCDENARMDQMLTPPNVTHIWF